MRSSLNKNKFGLIISAVCTILLLVVCLVTTGISSATKLSNIGNPNPILIDPTNSTQNNVEQINQWAYPIDKKPIQTMALSSDASASYDSLNNDILFFAYSNSISYLYHSTMHQASISIDDNYTITKLYTNLNKNTLYVLAKSNNHLTKFKLYQTKISKQQLADKIIFQEIIITNNDANSKVSVDDLFSHLIKFYTFNGNYIYLLGSFPTTKIMGIIHVTGSTAAMLSQFNCKDKTTDPNTSKWTFYSYYNHEENLAYVALAIVYLTTNLDQIDIQSYQWQASKPCDLATGVCDPEKIYQPTFYPASQAHDFFYPLAQGIIDGQQHWQIGAGELFSHYQPQQTVTESIPSIYINLLPYHSPRGDTMAGWYSTLLYKTYQGTKRGDNSQVYTSYIPIYQESGFRTDLTPTKQPFYKNGSLYLTDYRNHYWAKVDLLDYRESFYEPSVINFGGIDGNFKDIDAKVNLNLTVGNLYNPSENKYLSSWNVYYLNPDPTSQGVYQSVGINTDQFSRLLNPYLYKFKHKTLPTSVTFAGTTSYNIYLNLNYNTAPYSFIIWKIPIVNAYNSLSFNDNINGQALITSIADKKISADKSEIDININYFGTSNDYLYQDYFYSLDNPLETYYPAKNLAKNSTTRVKALSYKQYYKWSKYRICALQYLFQSNFSAPLSHYDIYINIANIKTLSLNYGTLKLENFTFADINVDLLDNLNKYNLILTQAIALSMNDPAANLGFVIVLQSSEIQNQLQTEQVWTPTNYPLPNSKKLISQVKPVIFKVAQELLDDRISQAMTFANIKTVSKLNKILKTVGYSMPKNKSQLDSYSNNQAFSVSLVKIVEKYNKIVKNRIIIGVCVSFGVILICLVTFKLIQNYRFNKKH